MVRGGRRHFPLLHRLVFGHDQGLGWIGGRGRHERIAIVQVNDATESSNGVFPVGVNFVHEMVVFTAIAVPSVPTRRLLGVLIDQIGNGRGLFQGVGVGGRVFQRFGHRRQGWVARRAVPGVAGKLTEVGGQHGGQDEDERVDFWNHFGGEEPPRS